MQELQKNVCFLLNEIKIMGVTWTKHDAVVDQNWNRSANDFERTWNGCPRFRTDTISKRFEKCIAIQFLNVLNNPLLAKFSNQFEYSWSFDDTWKSWRTASMLLVASCAYQSKKNTRWLSSQRRLIKWK